MRPRSRRGCALGYGLQLAGGRPDRSRARRRRRTAALPVPRGELADATQSVAVGAGSVWVGQGFDNPSYVWRLDSGNRPRAAALRDPGGRRAGAHVRQRRTLGRRRRDRAALAHRSGHERGDDAGARPRQLALLRRGRRRLRLGGGQPRRHGVEADEHGEVVSSVKLGATARELDYADGAVWAADGERGQDRAHRSDDGCARPTCSATTSSAAAVRGGVLAVERSARAART